MDALCWVGLAGDFADHAFTRYADEQGKAGLCLQIGQVAHELDIVLEVFAEADAGVEYDAFGADAGGLAGLGTGFQVACHFAYHILVLRVVLHGFGQALHVH